MNRFLRSFGKAVALVIALFGIAVLAPSAAYADPLPTCSAAIMSGTTSGHLANDPVSGLRVETWVTVNRDTGQTDTVTHVQSLLLLKGFTASSFSIAFDSCNRPIALTPPISTGVDGKWIGTSDRWRNANVILDTQVTRRIARIEVVNAHTPASAQEIYNRWRGPVCDGIGIISSIVGKPLGCP